MIMMYRYKLVRSVSEYLDIVDEITRRENRNQTYPKQIYYRGESEKNATITSLLYRKLYMFRCGIFGTPMFKFSLYEQRLIQDALVNYPHLFSECKTNVDMLVRMHQLFLPTRLVNITKNPLIALYFACKDNSDKGGRVLFAQQELTDLETVNKLILATRNRKNKVIDNRSFVSSILTEENIYNSGSGERVQLNKQIYINLIKPIFFQPYYWNESIRNQEGLFILTPLLQLRDKEKYKEIEWYILGDKKDSKYDDMIKSYTMYNCEGCVDNAFMKDAISIPYDYKYKILYELEKMGIHEAFVYADPVHQMHAVMTNVEEYIHKIHWIDPLD